MTKKRKSRKNKKYTPKSKDEHLRRYFPTQNAKLIFDALKRNKIKGSYKDYVVFMGNQMIDWMQTHTVTFREGELKERFGYLIHKKDLINVIGETEAEKFWHPKLGRIGIINRTKGKVGAKIYN